MFQSIAVVADTFLILLSPSLYVVDGFLMFQSVAVIADLF